MLCSGLKTKTNEKFIEESNIIHNNKYDYSLIEYKNDMTKIKIICPEHGVFEQLPNSHLRKTGCPICGGTKKSNIEDFIEKSNNIHLNKYNYSQSVYINGNSKVKIICPKHGDFYQTPHTHLSGCGCPKCRESCGEKEIRRFLIKNNIQFESQKIFDDCVHIKNLKFDFYLPDYNLCIEYNGLQHYAPIEYFGGKKSFLNQQKKDKIKKEFCEKNNINLLIIKYDESIEEKLKDVF